MLPATRRKSLRPILVAALGAVVLLIASWPAPGARAAAPPDAPAPLPAADADFRAARWGMSPAEVRASESAAPDLSEGPLLAFPATVAGDSCRVLYFFQDRKLCMGFYQWSDTHADLAPYFEDAERLRGLISAAYEEPAIENWDWEDPMFAEDPAMRAEALGLGLVRYELGWMNARSLVALRLAGGDLKADILVMYADRRCFPRGQDAFGAFFADRVGVPSPYYR